MNLQDLSSIKERILADVLEPAEKTRVLVGLATCGIASGAAPVLDKFNALAEGNDKVFVSQTGCVGICQYEPVVEVITPDKKKTLYVKVTPEKAEQIYNEHVLGGKPVEDFVVGTVLPSGEDNLAMSLEETVFLKKQTRIALRNCGHIDPEQIEQYVATDGYQALNKVLTTMSPDDVIQTMLDSGLRGRGGAGFPTGLKWKFASGNRGNVQKFVCCNADEGDPGAFMDRSVLEGDPHAVLEAMAIAGYAIGSNMGYIYVRAEYPLAITRLRIAIEQAKELGVLGDNIFGTDFSFDIDLRLGSGAFVCGEETALMTSIEGNRGEPRPRPPFPAVKGLFESPTILNNVETWANIPRIIMNGPEWFAGMGTEKSKGTKVFCLGGKINNTGLVEIEMGTTLKEVIEEIGGGIPNGKAFKAAQTGGPSGGCISTVNYEVPIDYDNLISIGSMMGSGGLIVMDEDNCMVDIAKFFLDFTVDESCGKCTPCRLGTKRLYEIMEKITKGEASMKDLEHLDELAAFIKDNALCGLGQTAPNPVLSTLRYFRDEYEAHIKQRKCPAGVCKELLHYNINPHKCVGCGLCKSKCPTDAIIGMLRKPHVIHPEVCVRCGTCITVCKQGAVEIV